MTPEQLERYAQAWNDHDIDTIMEMMTDDCVFEAGGGPDACGARFTGADVVRQRFVAVWQDVPDASFGDAIHFVAGDRGLSEWTFRGTPQGGSPIEVRGCDVFTFRGGLIHTKSTFLKNRQS